MSETVNQVNQNTNNENSGTTPERTFTQAELDAVIGERLSRERAKYVDYETLKEKASKFDKAEETCADQAKAILEFAKPSGYPSVRDDGEVASPTKGTAQEEFSECFRKAQK